MIRKQIYKCNEPGEEFGDIDYSKEPGEEFGDIDYSKEPGDDE